MKKDRQIQALRRVLAIGPANSGTADPVGCCLWGQAEVSRAFLRSPPLPPKWAFGGTDGTTALLLRAAIGRLGRTTDKEGRAKFTAPCKAAVAVAAVLDDSCCIG